MSGLMLAKKLMRLGYFWSTMEADCAKHVRHCHLCQVYADQIKAPPNELHPMAAPWPFSMWGIDVIGPINPKASNGHFFILVAIDYFTKWIKAITLASVTAKALCEQFKVQYRNSTPYCPQMNGAVEVANKNIKKIIEKMTVTYKDWHEMLHFALLAVLAEFELKEAQWAKQRYEQLNLIDEKRLTALCHGQYYQQRMARAFNARITFERKE
ncbi:hypothetical protein CRG98_022594 [Punica granatum]|uniref:Integrase catalytic domain-containing protein n=1 Tax=Punica granatum TaxID=22663 RepID=A0A2I0JMF7_PUNGR|nr:hypothetical protein CRG98_022594 [Punica granatum]